MRYWIANDICGLFMSVSDRKLTQARANVDSSPVCFRSLESREKQIRDVVTGDKEEEVRWLFLNSPLSASLGDDWRRVRGKCQCKLLQFQTRGDVDGARVGVWRLICSHSVHLTRVFPALSPFEKHIETTAAL